MLPKTLLPNIERNVIKQSLNLNPSKLKSENLKAKSVSPQRALNNQTNMSMLNEPNSFCIRVHFRLNWITVIHILPIIHTSVGCKICDVILKHIISFDEHFNYTYILLGRYIYQSNCKKERFIFISIVSSLRVQSKNDSYWLSKMTRSYEIRLIYRYDRNPKSQSIKFAAENRRTDLLAGDL